MTAVEPKELESRLRASLAERILVIDGAMGTMVQRYGLSESDFRGERFADHGTDLKGNNEVLVLTRPDVVREIHDQYLESGADLILTNAFSSNSISQSDYDLQDICLELNREAARIARESTDAWLERDPERPRYVVGNLGPTNRTLSLSPDVNDPAARTLTFDELKDAYAEQARGLLEGGAHILAVETIFDTLNAKAALVAIEEVFEARGERVPVMISVAITDASGRTLSGQTVEAFWASVRHVRPFSVGVNCSLGATDMRPYVAELAELADCYVTSYPNAGLPNAFGEYDEEPDTTGSL
ncbi:MAG: homocysteine S-methyltransferase family protein, partial [Myxococcota bacterium]|nr:homocysteine S-methyltransferase family protein [Myxococcota bacterium]